MKKLEYQIHFLTPAFLGNAEQNAQWRTPPFKTMLRKWWRILEAPNVEFDHKQLLSKENQIFGSASDESGNSKQSDIRIRLSDWSKGNHTVEEKGFQKVATTDDGKGKVSAEIYLGYGAITPRTRKDPRHAKPAINANGSCRLALISKSDSQHKTLQQIIALCHHLGTIGSRSNNGWGSLSVEAAESVLGIDELFRNGAIAARSLEVALTKDWPHCIAKADNNTAIWETSEIDTWTNAINYAAQLKVDIRRHAKTIKRAGLGSAGGIHFLGYPAGKDWQLNDQLRFASQLKFKVIQKNGKHALRVFHLPHAIPVAFINKIHRIQDKEWLRDTQNQINTWKLVYHCLDQYPTKSISNNNVNIKRIAL